MSVKANISVFRGAVIMVAMRWTDRLIGFVSTLVLARLLAPNDYGIIAMATLVISMVDVLLDLGVNVALIQNSSPTKADYDTAWTVRLFQTMVASVLVLGAAPFAAGYFNDHRVGEVLPLLSLTFLCSGLENIGVIAFQKERRYLEDFRFVSLKRLAAFVATMVAAYLLRSYWALVLGLLVGRVCGVVLSYWLQPGWPRVDLSRLREIFAVSQWMQLRSIGNYLDTNLHKLLVGHHVSPTLMGAYTLADEIAVMPSTELLAPVNRVLFPTYVTAKDSPGELKAMFLKAQGLQALVGIPAGIGLALVADEAVRLLLGAKWHEAVPFVQLLAVVNIASSIGTSGSYVLLTVGRTRLVALHSWLQFLIFAVGCLLFVGGDYALTVAKIRLAASLCGLFILLWFLLRTMPVLRPYEILLSVIRPLIGAGVMAACVTAVGDCCAAGMNVLALLAVKVGVGAASYAITVLALWQNSSGDGAESYLIDKLTHTLGTIPGLRQYLPQRNRS